MSFGGHVNDMVNRVKQNAALKSARRGRFKGGNDYSKTKNSKTTYDLPKLSKSELELYKKKVQEEAKIEKRKQLIFWSILAFSILIAVLIFNFY